MREVPIAIGMNNRLSIMKLRLFKKKTIPTAIQPETAVEEQHRRKLAEVGIFSSADRLAKMAKMLRNREN